MQSADLGDSHDGTKRRRLNAPRDSRIPLKREMGARGVVVVDAALQDDSEVLFAKDDQVVQAFAPDRPDDSLGVGVLPRGVRRGEDQPDHFRTDARPTSRLPSPEVPESQAVPAEDSLRPDQDEGGTPLVPDQRWTHPEGPVGIAEPGSPDASLQDGEPLTEGEIFQRQLRAVAKEGTEQQEDDSADGQRELLLGELVNNSGVECAVCR